MPFKKEDGQIIWIEPTKADKIAFKKVLTKESGVIPLTHELKSRVDEALRNVNPQKNNAATLTAANSSVYNVIKKLVQTPPGLVDIILPVHNSIHITKKCIKAVLEKTYWPYHLYIVDDCSDEFTKQYLEDIAKENTSKITLIRNTKNRGFAASVNRGIKLGNGKYICLLNSDVLVTDLWLTKMVIALKANNRHQIVCPATNNTAIVDIPLSPGASYIETNKIFESFTTRRYPEIMPTGFCFLFRRGLIDKIGYFDEAFQNFGEESAFWWNTIRYADGTNFNRYKAVLADDTYVFHERGSSYSQLGNETHMYFRKLATSRFNELYPEWVEWKKSYNIKEALGTLKDKIPPIFLRNEKAPYKICWVVHSAEMCGGMAFIKDIVNELNERGVCAKVVVIKVTPDARENFLGELTSAPVFFNNSEDFIHGFRNNVFPSGIVIASTSSLVPVVSTLCDISNGQLKPMLHTQSYEIDMVDYLKVPEEQEIVKVQLRQIFKHTPNILSSSNWITRELEKLKVKPFATVVPGVNIDLFYPRNRSKGDERPTVMIPLVTGSRGQTFIPGFDKVKGYERGLLLIQELERIADERGIELRILVYGTKVLPTISNAVCLGSIPQTRLATLLGNEVDVFIDPASLHSYGMPALEALASGVKVFSWNNKGIEEYGQNLDVTIFPNDEPVSNLAEAIIEYIENKDNQIIEDVILTNNILRSKIENYHNRENKVKEVIEAIEKHFNLHFCVKNISILVPHLRKHGGPTTMLAIGNELSRIGHNVSIKTYYNDIKDEVVAMTDLPVSFDCKNLGRTDLIITNSDHPLTEAIANAKNVKKIMLKLSHNARFKVEEEKGLQQNWDAIVTSSEWLKNVCENPTKDWNYPKKDNVHRIGWWHYTFDTFQCHPTNRTYGGGDIPFTITTLIHGHEMKGTREAILILGNLFLKLKQKVRFVGIGEAAPKSFDSDLPNFHYVYSPSRQEMATVLKQTDVWLGASKTEGLGRMGLEAMSAGCAVVLSNTGAEYARNEENCLIYPIGDLAAAERAIIRVLMDKELAFKLREEAYRTAAAAANPAPCIEVLQKVIEGIF